MNREKYVCNICQKIHFYEEPYWYDENGKVTSDEEQGCWCHGRKHESPYFICEKHAKLRGRDLPKTYCPNC